MRETERARVREVGISLPSTVSFLRSSLSVDRAGPSQNQKLGPSHRSLPWVQRSKHLGQLALLLQVQAGSWVRRGAART